jgi:hypothetical protein
VDGEPLLATAAPHLAPPPKRLDRRPGRAPNPSDPAPSHAAGGAPDMQKILIVFGAAIMLMGLFWPWLSKLGLGRLPGDIVLHRDNLTLYFPITTMILISIILTLLLRFLGK